MAFACLENTMKTSGIKTTCEKCGGPLILFTSLRYKECGYCNQRYTWELGKGQKPIFDETGTDNSSSSKKSS